MNISVRIILTSFASVALNFCAQAAQTLDGAKIDQLTGLKGKMNDVDGVYKVSQPRNDIKVTVDGLQMPPFMGLTSWAAFVSGKTKEAMVMGDLVLMQDEVNPVMSAALESGLEVTALHNHFFYDEPKVYFMHIGGEGETDSLAKAVRALLDAVNACGQTIPASQKVSVAHPSLPKAPSQPNPCKKVLSAKGESETACSKLFSAGTSKCPAVAKPERKW